MQKESSLFFEALDYRGKKVVFTQKKWREKSKTHPYLKLPQFKNFIQIAIENPTEVWQDYDEPRKKRCYYYKYSTTMYVKVVVWISDDPCRVVTVFNLDYIKEMNYPNLRRLK